MSICKPVLETVNPSICSARARDCYDREAKERQKARVGNQPGASTVVVPVPQLETGKARDKAGIDHPPPSNRVDKIPFGPVDNRPPIFFATCVRVRSVGTRDQSQASNLLSPAAILASISPIPRKQTSFPRLSGTIDSRHNITKQGVNYG